MRVFKIRQKHILVVLDLKWEKVRAVLFLVYSTRAIHVSSCSQSYREKPLKKIDLSTKE